MGQVFAPWRNFHRPLLQLRQKGDQVGTGCLGQTFASRYVSRKNRQQIIKKAVECPLFLLYKKIHAKRTHKTPPRVSLWYSRRESNPQRPLRRGLLYPFNYGSLFIWSIFWKSYLFYPCRGTAVNAVPDCLKKNLLLQSAKILYALLDFLAVA